MQLFQITHLWQTKISTALLRWKTMYRYSHLYCHSFILYSHLYSHFIPFLLLFSLKWNTTPVLLVIGNNKAGILNTLFKVKLLALVEQHVALLKWNFPCAFFFCFCFLGVGGGVVCRQLFFRVSVSGRFWKTIQQRFSIKY